MTVANRTVADVWLGDDPQANNHYFVDQVANITGGNVTIFSKQGHEFIRIATNVKRNGERAVGTALDPRGAVMPKVSAGDSFYGMVDILGVTNVTAYEPLRDAAGEIVGLVFVGFPADLSVLDDAIAPRRVLEHGFLALQDAQQHVRVHSQHQTQQYIETALQDSGWQIDMHDFAPWK